MIEITEFHTINDLIAALSGKIKPVDCLSDDLLMISQSRPLIDLINYKLAQSRGVFIKPRIELGESSFRQLLSGLSIDGVAIEGIDKVVFPDSLSLWIWDFLSKPDQDKILENLGLSGSNSLRIFEYSTALAKAYHQYTLNNEEPEAWQSDEFDKRIVYEKLLSEAEDRYVTLGAMLSRTTKKLKTAAKIELPFKRIIVVGSAFLPTKGIEFLQALRGVDLEFMVVNPLVHSDKPSYNLEPWLGFGRKNFKAFSDKSLVGNTLALDKLSEIAVVACPSKQHEVRFIKEKILEILGNEPETPLNQIGIIAPDPFEYEPYLKSIFADSDPSFDLGLHIVDEEIRPLSSLASVLRVFSFHKSSLRRSEVLELLSFEPIQKTFGLNPSFFESLKEWIIESGIFEHVDGDSRDAEGILSGERGTWSSLLQKIGSLLLRGPSEILPIKSLGSSHFEAVEGFMKFLVTMREFQKETGVQRHIKDWATYTRELFNPEKQNAFVTWSTEDDEEHQRIAFGNVISNTVNLTHDMKGFETKIDFEFYLSLLQEQLDNQYVQKGQSLLHGVTIGRFSPARLIPFKHLFVIGLNDKAFPSPETHRRLETINGKPIKESRDQDLYCLVEMFASVSNSIHFSYQARDPKSREWTPPSSVLWSLKDWLKGSVNSYELTLTPEDPAGHQSDTLFDTKFAPPPRISLKKVIPEASEQKKSIKLGEFINLEKFKALFTEPFSTFYGFTEQFSTYYQSENSIDDDPDYDLRTTNRKKLKLDALEAALRFGPSQASTIINSLVNDTYLATSTARDFLPNFSFDQLKTQDLLELDDTLEGIGRFFKPPGEEFDPSQVVESRMFRIPTHEALEIADGLPKIVADQAAWQYKNRVIVFDTKHRELKEYGGYLSVLAKVAQTRVNLDEFSQVESLTFVCLETDKSYLKVKLSLDLNQRARVNEEFLTFYRGIFDSPKPLFSDLIHKLIVDPKTKSTDPDGIETSKIIEYLEDEEPNDYDFNGPYKDIFFKLFMNSDKGDEAWIDEAKKSLDSLQAIYELFEINEVKIGQN